MTWANRPCNQLDAGRVLVRDGDKNFDVFAINRQPYSCWRAVSDDLG